MSKYAPSLVDFVICFVLINIAFFVSKKYALKEKPSKAGWVWLVVFCLFSRWEEDYFAMEDYFYTPEYFETFRDSAYQYVQWFSLGSYIVFRLIVWGGAIYYFNKTIKLYNLSSNLTCFVFAVMYLQTFSYPRASMAMALFFYGFSILVTAKRVRLKTIINSALYCALAYPFHRSILPLIALSPVALFKIKSKKPIVLIFILVPTIIGLISQFMTGFIGNGASGFDSTDSFAAAASFYSNIGNETEFNWKFRLVKELRTSSFVVAYIYLLYKFYWKNDRQREVYLDIQPLFLVLSGLILLSLAFLYIIPVGAAYLIGERYLNMVGIPIVILLSYAYKNGYITWRKLLFLLILPLMYSEGYLLGKLFSPNIH